MIAQASQKWNNISPADITNTLGFRPPFTQPWTEISQIQTFTDLWGFVLKHHFITLSVILRLENLHQLCHFKHFAYMLLAQGSSPVNLEDCWTIQVLKFNVHWSYTFKIIIGLLLWWKSFVFMPITCWWEGHIAWAMQRVLKPN